MCIRDRYASISLSCRLNLIESQLWNEDNWRGKYIGIVPRRGKDDKVCSFSTGHNTLTCDDARVVVDVGTVDMVMLHCSFIVLVLQPAFPR